MGAARNVDDSIRLIDKERRRRMRGSSIEWWHILVGGSLLIAITAMLTYAHWIAPTLMPMKSTLTQFEPGKAVAKVVPLSDHLRVEFTMNVKANVDGTFDYDTYAKLKVYSDHYENWEDFVMGTEPRVVLDELNALESNLVAGLKANGRMIVAKSKK